MNVERNRSEIESRPIHLRIGSFLFLGLVKRLSGTSYRTEQNRTDLGVRIYI